MSRRTILIAEDDTKLLTVLRLRFEDAGFEVLPSQDAYQAVAVALQHQPDVLLLDINMPAGSGISVRERIKKLPEIAHMPIVFMTGEDPARIGEMMSEHRGDLASCPVIRKPFKAEDAVALVVKAIKKQELAHPA